MFFDDSVAEAVSMWVIEATAIFFEFLVYRTKVRIFNEESERLAKTDEDLAELNKSRREFRRSLHNSMHGSRHHNFPYPLEEVDDDSDSSGDSFGGSDSSQDLAGWDNDDAEDEERPVQKKINRNSGAEKSSRATPAPNRQRNDIVTSSRTFDIPAVSGHLSGHESFVSSSRTPKIGERKEMRLLRERRILRQKQQAESRDLNFHFIGCCINICLIVISLLLIITISSTGGLCVYNGSVKIFSMDQLGKCNECRGTSDECQVCNSDGTHQCYYPYY